jgi:hypothetical protein
LNRLQRLLVIGVAALGAIGLTGTSVSAEPAPTSDGYRVNYPEGYVEWNDYGDDDSSIDYDNVWVVGRAGDGMTFRVTASYKGEVITRSIGDGSQATISFSNNVLPGDTVSWQACVLNDGRLLGCYPENGFIE